MPDTPLLFVLDQNFPKPVFDVHAVDATVSYEHLSDYAPALAENSTPRLAGVPRT